MKQQYDLIVAGGGMSGVAAAVAAGRKGLNVLLIEQSSMLGGLGTSGLMTMIMTSRHWFYGIGKEIIDGLISEGNARIYEENYHKEQKEWSRKLRFTILRNIGIAMFYIIIFCISDILTGYVQDFISVLLNEQISSNLFFDIAINVGMFTILFAIVNSLLSKSIHLPDILESVEAIFLSVKDSVVVHKVEEKSYHRRAIEK